MLSLINKRLGVDLEEANNVLSMMLERKHFLFPDEVQPNGVPFMLMRKEVSYLITKFDHEKLNLRKKIIPANALEIKLFENLHKLDQYVSRFADYDKYEKLFLKIQDEVFDRFNVWLDGKGVNEHQEHFAFIAQVYLQFIYGNLYEQPLLLKDAPGKYLVDFMLDYILRKTAMEPWEYTLAPAALRLFYRFLYEKEYLQEPPDFMMEFIDVIEPNFIEYLKEEFS